MIAVFLDCGNVLADALGAIDFSFQEIVLLCFHCKLLLWRVRGGGKPPTVGGKRDIREDEKNHTAENHSFPQSEVAPHQILE